MSELRAGGMDSWNKRMQRCRDMKRTPPSEAGGVHPEEDSGREALQPSQERRLYKGSNPLLETDFTLEGYRKPLRNF